MKKAPTKKPTFNKLAMVIFVISVVFTSSGALASRDTSLADKLGFDEIVFIKRKPLSSDHSYTDIDNGTKADRFDAGNGIFIYNLKTKKQRPVITAANMVGGKVLSAR